MSSLSEDDFKKRYNTIRLQLKARTEQRDEEIRKREAEKASLNEQIDSLKSQLSDANRKTCATPIVQTNSPAYDELLAELRAEKEKIATEHFDDNQWLGKQISELMDLKQKIASLSKVEEENEALVKQVAEMGQRLAIVEAENSDLKKTLHVSQEELTSADGEIRKLTSELSSEKAGVWSRIPASVTASPHTQTGSTSRSSFATVESVHYEQLHQLQTDFIAFKDFINQKMDGCTKTVEECNEGLQAYKSGMDTVLTEISQLSKKVDGVHPENVVAIVEQPASEFVEYDAQTDAPVQPPPVPSSSSGEVENESVEMKGDWTTVSRKVTPSKKSTEKWGES